MTCAMASSFYPLVAGCHCGTQPRHMCWARKAALGRSFCWCRIHHTDFFTADPVGLRSAQDGHTTSRIPALGARSIKRPAVYKEPERLLQDHARERSGTVAGSQRLDRCGREGTAPRYTILRCGPKCSRRASTLAFPEVDL